MLDPSPGLSGLPGFVRFSFCRLLQNQTRTTSFSIHKLSAKLVISWLVGFELIKKAFSRATRTDVSIEVRFFRRRPIVSGVVRGLLKVLGPNILRAKERKSLFFTYKCFARCKTYPPGLFMLRSASSNHFCSSGFSLHMFLKLKFNASNRDMVVWEKSLP